MEKRPRDFLRRDVDDDFNGISELAHDEIA
jgi:hypothetical protein